MIDIVIVDDEQKYHNKIKSIVSKIGIQYDTTINIKDYYNYDEYLESEIKNTDLAKIYILDINLSSSISGISIAKKIKEDDWNSEIILLLIMIKCLKQFIEIFQTYMNLLKSLMIWNKE